MTQTDDTANDVHLGEDVQEPTFPVARRGYKRSAVDEKIRHYLAEIGALNKQCERLRGEATLASERITELEARVSERDHRAVTRETSAYGSAGDKIAGMLRAAEKQAAEILAKAGRDAEKQRRETDEEAARLRRAAHEDAEVLLSEQCVEIERLRAEAIASADSYRKRIQAEADGVIEDAHAEAEQLRTAATQELDALRAKARSEAANIRAEVDREVAETRRILAQEKERLSLEVHEEHESALRNAEILWSEVTSGLAERARRIEEASERSVTSRDAIVDEAQETLKQAQAHAEQVYAGAQKRAEYAESRGRDEAQRVLESAQNEAGAVKHLRADIANKLSNLQQELRELNDDHAPTDVSTPDSTSVGDSRTNAG